MRILYAIQGTGNGHLSRANDIIPLLEEKAKLDILVSGIQADVSIPYEIKYRLRGMSFIFGTKGGVDIRKTLKKTNARQLISEIRNLPVNDYDLIINDFEPVSAWAAKLKKIPCIALSHQAAVLNRHAPKPEKSDILGKSILKYYAPAYYAFGFHFEEYDENIFTPVIRQQVRKQEVKNNGHYTVYLPAYGDNEIIQKLSLFSDVNWQVFSKHSSISYRCKNVHIAPINNEEFIKSIALSHGVLCGAGFETPAEALYLDKKLMVIPMKTQYEQQCNAAALRKMGIPVINNLDNQNLNQVEDWINADQKIVVNYPNNTEYVIDKLLDFYLYKKEALIFAAS